MIATTTHIETPPHFKPHDDYSSHRPLMWLVFEKNKDKLPVVEFGSGMASTMLFRDWCNSDSVMFTSYENDKEWCKTTGARYVEDYKKLEVPNETILFIDSRPGEERKDLVDMHRDKQLIVLHDTQKSCQSIYGIADVLQSFKYRLDFCPEGYPATTVLSNHINVAKWI